MTKREEIREIIEGVNSGGLSVDEGLRELDIAGCVIKVDRDRLLEYNNYNDSTRELDDRFKIVAVEPLIGRK